MAEFFDTYETQAPEVREASLMADLPRQIAHAQDKTEYFGKLLAGVEPGDITSCLLYTSPSPRDLARSRMPSSA